MPARSIVVCATIAAAACGGGAAAAGVRARQPRPSAIRIAIGGTLALTGAFAVPQDTPDPRNVTSARGKIAYRRLMSGAPGQPPGSQAGLLIVQMLADDRI
jgi:hypothetical protein